MIISLKKLSRPVWMRILVVALILGAAGAIYWYKSLPSKTQCSGEACQVQEKAPTNSDNKITENKKEAGKSEAEKKKEESKPNPTQPKPSQPGGSTGGGSSQGGGSSDGGGGTTTPPPSGGNGTQSCPAYPAFPDENCTGVPPGVSLSSVSNFSSTSNGQTISGLSIAGDLAINHSNVTVTNTRIKGRVINNGNNLVMRDVDIGPDSCPGSSNGGNRLIANAGYALVRAHLHNNAADLVHMGGGGNVLIQDSLINKTCYYSGDHLDGIQFYDPGGVLTATLQHNAIDVRPVNGGGYGNAAIFWADFPGAGSRLNVYNNYLAGGNYTLYGLDAHASSGVVIDVSGNRFQRNAYNYGPCVFSNSVVFNGTSGVLWTNNTYSDGAAINLGDC